MSLSTQTSPSAVTAHNLLAPCLTKTKTMAPALARSSSQSKISDTFRSGAKATKPLKQTKQATAAAVKPTTKPAALASSTLPADGKHLNVSDPKLVTAARAIEADRQAPFGRLPLVKEVMLTK